MAKIEAVEALETKLRNIDWKRVHTALDERGFTIIKHLFNRATCRATSKLFEQDQLFRNHIVMQRHGYGQGEYRYFNYPLPEHITCLRTLLYRQLAPVANGWASRLKLPGHFPEELTEFISECHAHDQLRPTPLLLRYGKGDYNRLHQDLYGEVCFPIQVAILLDEPETDFAGGEFVLTEQKARMQSRPHVVNLRQGDAVVFAVNERPAAGPRGYHRVKMRHGVSELRSGSRHTLGIIFHDAS